MKNQPHGPLTFRSIAEAHSACGLPKPQHPLVSLIDTVATPVEPLAKGTVHVSSFYKLAYRLEGGSKFHYGQGQYGFEEGSLLFAAPNQLLGCEENTTWRGYMLCLHPDFLLGYPLARTIKQYNFFSYSANEALRLADTEHATITSLFQLMESEVRRPHDDFSSDVFVAQVELLLAYAHRFYKRQFITHRTVERALHQQIDDILDHYFTAHHALRQGLPTVNYLAAQVHVTPSYLSDMLRALTGLSAQQHIHQKLIEKAKEQLSITQRSVSEIAHALGFEHAQSFSKLFKAKTATSPLAFRRSFRSRE